MGEWGPRLSLAGWTTDEVVRKVALGTLWPCEVAVCPGRGGAEDLQF